VNGDIGRYIVDMGADIELFEISSRIPPWEDMRRLTRDELRRMRIHTIDDPFARLAAPPASGATASIKKPEPAPVTSVNTLGWTVVDRRGQRTLVRQHPITIEGAEIGTFEIAFTCGDKPDAYQVSYRERRIVPNSPAIPTDRLRRWEFPSDKRVRSAHVADA
jgi:hypothetical protein